jgi:hypothetical protein
MIAASLLFDGANKLGLASGNAPLTKIDLRGSVTVERLGEGGRGLSRALCYAASCAVG